MPFQVLFARQAGASRQEVISAILLGLPAADHVVTQVLPAAHAAYDCRQSESAGSSELFLSSTVGQEAQMRPRNCIVLLLVVMTAACRGATGLQVTATTVSPTTAAPQLSGAAYRIDNVSVVDVDSGSVSSNQTVVVEGDRITLVVSSSDPNVPTGGQTLDGRGLYLIPGLVDAHVHFYDAPVFGRLLLANGVVLVRDTGMPNEYILPLRDQLNRGEIPGPEMVATGAILDGNPALIPSISLTVSTADEARSAVQSQAAAGVNLIKVYSSLPRDALLAVLDEAKRLALKVVGHVPDTIYLEDAVTAGLSCSEHFFGFEKAVAKLLGAPVRWQYVGMGSDAAYLTRLPDVAPQTLTAFYERLRLSGLTVCPTVVVFEAATRTTQYQSGRFEGQEYVSPSVVALWNAQWGGQGDLPNVIWQSWARMVCDLNKAGVPLMVGTDLSVPGILPGFSVHQEMLLWQEAGIPPADVLRGATLTPARFLGLDTRLGSIAEGKDASMVLLRGNPLEDVRHAAEIEGVFLRGKYYDRTELDRLLEKARELVRNPSP